MTGLPERVTLSHGSGGRAMSELIEAVFAPAFGSAGLVRDDSAVLNVDSSHISFTTDSFVVDPIFFPGGDIGRLAIAGTVNDLLTSAAKPVAISASFVIEEGFLVADLIAIAESMASTAEEAGVPIATGDTKVVPRGSADKIYITTSGIGAVLRPGVSGAAARAGDNVILTGSIGDHGTAVILAREKLLSSVEVSSDAAPLTDIVMNLIDSGCEIHAMRDPTRGGIGSALNEIAAQSGVSVRLDEGRIAVKPTVNAVCEALGLEPYYVANEGKMLIFVAGADADRALSVVRSSRYGRDAAIIGEVYPFPAGRVDITTAIGTSRILSSPTGELLPRIC